MASAKRPRGCLLNVSSASPSLLLWGCMTSCTITMRLEKLCGFLTLLYAQMVKPSHAKQKRTMLGGGAQIAFSSETNQPRRKKKKTQAFLLFCDGRVSSVRIDAFYSRTCSSGWNLRNVSVGISALPRGLSSLDV